MYSPDRRQLLICGAAAGIAAPLLLATIFVALTLTDRAFLRDSGWSAVKRTDVEWPSLLELGPHGWILQVAFVCAGLLGIAFGVALFVHATQLRERAAAVAFLLMSAAVAAMALPPHRPGAPTESWQGVAHNRIYPAIPVCALVAAAMHALGRDETTNSQHAATAFLVVGAVTLALMLVDAIAQLMRFVFFGSLLLWVGCVAVTLLLQLDADRRDAAQATR